ncbi:hypothetical protein RMSM_02033 [Rhodopirellula maiorica SM1]|uniref:Uncharacterized protein n=1 Tax=Rhodopirellula maiorica SM1 TaxID=1265738 RepID=M5RNX6_9BACT|nr:hypothetical protein RMSM_02033 [Rhodopirellula maiorica SM1]
MPDLRVAAIRPTRCDRGAINDNGHDANVLVNSLSPRMPDLRVAAIRPTGRGRWGMMGT